MKLERFHVQLSIWHCCFWMNRTERVPLVKSWFHLRFPHAYPNQPGSTLISLIISDTLLNIWCTKPIQNPDPFYLPMDWLLRNLDWGWMLCRCEVIHSMFLVAQLPSNQCCSLGFYIVDQTIQSNNILTPISMNEYCILIVDTRYSMLIGFSRSTTKLESGGCKCRVATDSRGGNIPSLKST